MTHKTLFISDLHLEEARPDLTQQFFQLLSNCDTTIDALYILGDLFEAWIGDDDDTAFHRSIIQALKAASNKGLAIFFIRGNRDFLIGKRFLTASHCKLLADEEKMNLYGTPILLMHGDTLCTQDIHYLKWRKRVRHPFFSFLCWLAPLKLRRFVAVKMRAKSKRYTQSVAPMIMDVTAEGVAHYMQKHQVHVLIHGHTHRPKTHEFNLANLPATRIVLPSWHDGGSVLVWDETDKKEIVKINDFI